MEVMHKKKKKKKRKKKHCDESLSRWNLPLLKKTSPQTSLFHPINDDFGFNPEIIQTSITTTQFTFGE